MIRGDEQNAAHVLHSLFDLAHALVDGLHSLHCSFHDTGVSHHVAVGEVHDDRVVLAGSDGLGGFRGHLPGAHLGDEVIGGKLLRARNEDTILPRADALNAAVEEEGDMGVFLRLRDAKLGQAVLAEEITEGLGDGLRRKGDGKLRHCLVILRGADIVHREKALRTLETVKIRLVERPGHLPGAVRAEV